MKETFKSCYYYILLNKLLSKIFSNTLHCLDYFWAFIGNVLGLTLTLGVKIMKSKILDTALESFMWENIFPGN